jgi:hypothetical protein
MRACRTDTSLRPAIRAVALAALYAAGLGLAGLVPALPAGAQASGQPMPLLVIPSPEEAAPPPAAPAKQPSPAPPAGAALPAAPAGAPLPAAPAGMPLPAAPAGMPPPPAVPLPSVSPLDVSVTRQMLAAPPLGVLMPEQGGFPATLWAGTPAALVRALLPALPDMVASPAVHGLARRLLLSAATPPADSSPADAAALIELRVSRLLALGEIDGARQLAESIPAAFNSPALARLRWEAQMLTGRVADACAGLGAAGSAGDGELAEGQVLCQLAAGNTLAANVGLDVLRDRKPADTTFIAAAEVLAGLPPTKGGITSLRDPTPLQFAALRAAKLPLPPDAVDTARPAVLAAVAEAADVAPDLRLAAAERAEAQGILATDGLRRLVEALELSPEELAQPLAHVDGMAGSRALALLARAAEAARDPAVQMPLLAKALDLAAARGRAATAARLLAPQIAMLSPQPAFAGFAPAAARALLIAGRPDVAGTWLDLAGRDPAAAKAAARLWPLARVWGVGDPAAVTAWARDTDPRQAASVLAVVTGLGLRVPEPAWVPLLGVPRSAGGPGPALTQLLADLARDGGIGGTVLTALACIDPAGFDKTDPTALAQAVAGLKAIGLEADAHRLATEILLADGV